MKKSKVVVPALGLVAFGVAASITGTVAWFTARNTVTVTGMQVKTKVGSNLTIAEVNRDAYFSESLSQVKKGILAPTSTVNGENFFYTPNGKANGDASSDVYKGYEDDGLATATDTVNYGNKFSEDYDISKTDVQTYTTVAGPALGYIDYSFYLRGASTAADQILSLSKCNLLYGGAALTSGFAWRVAVYASLTTANTDVDDATVVDESNVVTILDMAKSLNQNEVVAEVLPAAAIPPSPAYFTDPNLQTPATGTADGKTTYYKASAENGSPKAVSAKNAAPTAVTYNTEANIDDDFDATTKYYKVVVRLWLEGEDVSCTSTTFAALDSSWSLDLEFKLSDADGVTVIGSTAA